MYVFPIHLNGENRGCEAIALGISQILQKPREQMIAYCDNVVGDENLGLNKYYTLVPFKQFGFWDKCKNKIFQYLHHSNLEYIRANLYSKQYDEFLNIAGRDDVMVSTGGDMLCYSNNQVNYTVNYAKSKGMKTILWGCSLGKENLTPEKIDALKKFDIIVARESLTETMLKTELKLNNVFLYPDSAFVLEPQECPLPAIFETAKVIGINLSNFVSKSIESSSIIVGNIRKLISSILEKTDYNILFIPHVIRKGQDDRLFCNMMNDEFKHSRRTSVLDSENYNYCSIRYIISKCDCFIGARTHSVISAYSTCTPALALGYSIKSRGIAIDLDLSPDSVINCMHLNSKSDICVAFWKFFNEKEKIRNILVKRIPEYVNRAYAAKKVLEFF